MKSKKEKKCGFNSNLSTASGIPKPPEIDAKLKGRLKIAVFFTALIFFAELIGGLLTNSLALLSDSAHVFMDVLALSLSLLAIYASERPPTSNRTFGLHRVEVLVALINGISIVLMALFIFYKAYFRLINPEEVESVGMLVVALIGLIVNLGVAFYLMRYAKNDLNIKSAFLHVLGDAVASVGVIIGAVVIYYTGYYAIDAMISVFIGFIIFLGATRIIGEAAHILLEGVPKEVSLPRVVDDITDLEGVAGVHSIHIWSICHNVYALSAHIEVTEGIDISRNEQGCLISDINEMLADTHHITYTTLQLDCSRCERGKLFRTMVHEDHGHGHSH
ncbi:MAG: cation transporter [Deltaproteobacteria bacterium]|nr:cation transporter [Deltaproteobacteria bacterium]